MNFWGEVHRQSERKRIEAIQKAYERQKQMQKRVGIVKRSTFPLCPPNYCSLNVCPPYTIKPVKKYKTKKVSQPEMGEE